MTSEPNGTGKAAARGRLRELPRWKKVLLAVAVGFVLVGAVLKLTTGSASSAPEPGASPGATAAGEAPAPAAGSVRSLGGDRFPPNPGLNPGSTTVPVPGSLEEPPAGEGEHDWSPFFFKGGFGFFGGFCMGYAVRMFFRISAAAFGLLFLALFGMSYLGLIEVDWAAAERLYDSLTATLAHELSGFQAFIEGSIPSAGMSALGLWTGFKRR